MFFCFSLPFFLSEALKKNSSESAKETSDGQSNHYLPKRGICVDKCCYVSDIFYSLSTIYTHTSVEKIKD